ncbi:MAG: TraB/GumN family protein [Paramuribaculum sp.]|nr:TraB/GumN family protein [Paramuribaculum sp.]MDE6487668.1 TraB/GumN family protein [Paramuribaculum sp.]
MKRTAQILTLLLILASTVSANAQLLWKISGKDAAKPSWIFGTHHLAPVSVLESTPGFDNAFKSAETIYGEIDMSLLEDPATQMKMVSYVLAPADSTLSKVLDPNSLATIDRMLKEGGLPVTAAALEQLKPASVSNTIAAIYSQKAFPGFNPEQQLDKTIQKMARENAKQVRGLESLESQLDLLFGTPVARQAEGLKKLLEDPEKTVGQIHSLADAYLAADLNGLAELIAEAQNDGMTEEEARLLLENRNRAWLDILIGAIPTASILIVVGAGHLPGDTGLISLLRNAGYTVEPVK